MATADELLAALTNSDEDETILIIDNDLRTISIPKSIKALGVESDDEVHRLYFQMPRMCGDVDLSTFNIRINYMNANREGDIYVVTDKKILSNSITFSWLVGRNALAYKGDVNFIVCLKESNASGDVLREFNTTVASLPVLEGLEVDPAYLEGELHDVLEQLLSLTVAKVAEVEAAGAAQIVKVQQESTKQQANITEHGAQVLATIPAEYQTTAKLADEGVRSKADAIIRTAEGKHIQVHDASDDNLRGLKLFGKTKQFTTTGKNLLGDNRGLIERIENGITFTPVFRTDGLLDYILLNGTATARTDYWCTTVQGYKISVPKGETVTVSGGTENVRVWLQNSTYTQSLCHPSQGSAVPATAILEYDTYGCWITVASGVTVNNEKIRPQLEIGSVATAYEPYTGGIPSPNPDYPQPLVSPGNGGNINTTVAGKNLFGGDALADKLVEVASSTKDISAGTVTISGTNVTYNPMLFDGAFKENTQYTIVLYGRNNAETGDATNMSIFYTDGTNEDIRFPKVSGDRYVVHTTMTGKTVSHLYCRYQSGISILYYDKCGIFEGVLTEADFEPYVGSNLTASTPNGLPGIPVTSGGNYTDENGQQWVCDEVDFERGVYMQRIAAKTLDGSISYQEAGTQVGGTYTVFTVFSDIWIKETDRFISDIFRCYSSEKYRTGDAEGIYSNPGDANCNLVIVRVNNSRATDMDTFKQWITEHPCVVYCPLKTPIETPLSAADLASFKAAKTVKPYTQIFNDSDVEMEASYNADTEIYIDNKIAERVPRNSYVAPAIVETKSGEVIGVSDSSDDPVRGLKLFGKTKQFTTTGKNLLDFEECLKAWGSSYTKNGEKYTITSIGTAYTSPSKLFEERTTVSVQAIVKDIYSTNALVEFGYFAEDGTFISIANLNNSANSKENVAINAIRMNFSVGGTFTVENIQLEKGSTATAYEPYTGGIAAPSPEYPQPLESVGASGAINTTVCGKNLADITTHTATAIYNTVATLVDSRAIKKGEVYTVSIYLEAEAETIAYWNGDLEIFDLSKITVSKGKNRYSRTFTAMADGKLWTDVPYSRRNIINKGADDGIIITGYDAQIEHGSVTTPYEPYKGQTLTASTPNGLPGIPVTSGGNYTDESGQQWICDEVDFARGVYVQRVNTEVFDGTEKWSNADKEITYDPKLEVKDNGKEVFCLCSHYPSVTRYQNYNHQNEDGWLSISASGWRIRVVDNVNCNGDPNELKTLLAEKYASGNPVTIHYALATPIETPLTRAELEAYRAAALHTNYPSTTIINDANAGQEVTYVADTKNWIKNQLAL